jgi:hypothetical protein
MNGFLDEWMSGFLDEKDGRIARPDSMSRQNGSPFLPGFRSIHKSTHPSTHQSIHPIIQ